MCMFLCLGVEAPCASTYSTHRGQKWAFDPLENKLQVVIVSVLPVYLVHDWKKECGLRKKIDERLKIKSEGHSSEYWIRFMFISNSLFIHQSRKEGKGERLFLTQIQRTQKVVTFLVSKTSNKHTLGQNILFLWPSRNNNTLKLSDLRSRWSQATLMVGRRL